VFAAVGSLKLTKIGVGSWQASVYSWNSDIKQVEEALKTAFQFGINWVDTAEIYGRGASEELVGKLAREYDVYIATKVAGFRYRDVVKAVRASLRRLGRIDLLQLHWPPPIYLDVCKILRQLESAIELGLAAEIGVCNFDVELLEKAIYCTKRHKIVSNQIEYSPLARAAEREVFKKARELGVEIIAWGPLAKGAVLGRAGNDRARRMDSTFRKAETEGGRRAISVIKRIAEERNMTPAQVVLAWHKAKGVLPIPGDKRREQAIDVANALRIELSEDDVRKIDEASEEFLKGTVGFRRVRWMPGFLQRLILAIFPF